VGVFFNRDEAIGLEQDNKQSSVKKMTL